MPELIDVLATRLSDAATVTAAQVGQVTAIVGNEVVVAVRGDTVTLPKLASYSAVVGHVVVILPLGSGNKIVVGRAGGPYDGGGTGGGEPGPPGEPGTPGTPGAPGAAGRSVTDATVDGSGHLILTFSDGTTDDTGNVVGPQGAAGSGSTDTVVRTALFGGSARTAVPRCQVFLGTNFTYSTAQGDLPAQAGWTLGAQSDSGMFHAGSTGTPAYIQVPVAGRYVVHYRCMATNSETGALVAVKITKTGTTVTTQSIATGPGVITASTGESAALDAYAEVVLAASDKIYWSNWGNRDYTVNATLFGGVRTVVDVRYVAPT